MNKNFDVCKACPKLTEWRTKMLFKKYRVRVYYCYYDGSKGTVRKRVYIEQEVPELCEYKMEHMILEQNDKKAKYMQTLPGLSL